MSSCLLDWVSTTSVIMHQYTYIYKCTRTYMHSQKLVVIQRTVTKRSTYVWWMCIYVYTYLAHTKNLTYCVEVVYICMYVYIYMYEYKSNSAYCNKAVYLHIYRYICRTYKQFNVLWWSRICMYVCIFIHIWDTKTIQHTVMIHCTHVCTYIYSHTSHTTCVSNAKTVSW